MKNNTNKSLNTDMTNMLDVCCDAVDRMARYLEYKNYALGEELGEELEKNELRKLFHTLGASVGNMLCTYQETLSCAEIVNAFKAGMNGFIDYCGKSESLADWLASNWFVDNNDYKN